MARTTITNPRLGGNYVIWKSPNTLDEMYEEMLDDPFANLWSEPIPKESSEKQNPRSILTSEGAKCEGEL